MEYSLVTRSSDDTGRKSTGISGQIKRHWPFALVLFIGIGVSLGAFLIVDRMERHKIRHEFEEQAAAYANILQHSVQMNVQELASIAGLYAASGEVDRREFHAFTQTIFVRSDSIWALSWLPRVPAAGREAFERAAQAEGFSDYHISERSADGEMMPATPRGEYYPAHFVEPPEMPGRPKIFGFDTASRVPTRLAMMSARDSGKPIASARIKLILETGDQFAFLVFHPIYRYGEAIDTVSQRRAALVGFVAAVFRIGHLIETSLTKFFAVPAGLDFYVHDDSAEPENSLLYIHSSRTRRERLEPGFKETVRTGMYSVHTLNVAGSGWSVVFKPAPGHFVSGFRGVPLGVLLVGLLLTALLANYQRTLRINNIRISRVVAERTADLTTTNEKLNAEIVRREMAAKALKISEKRFSGILNNSPDAIISVNDEHQIILFNQGAEKIFGYASEEILGQPVHMLLSVSLRDRHRELMNKFGKSSTEFRSMSDELDIAGLRKDGTEFPAEASISQLVSGDQTIFTVILHDITERKEVEEALRESEAKLNAFFENAPVGLATFDDQLRFTKINAALAGVNGIPAEEHIGRTIADVQPALAPIIEPPCREILETGKPQLNTELKAILPGGGGAEQHLLSSRFPIPGKDGRPEGVGAVVVDITDRKRAEEAAKESEEKYRSLVELSPDAVFVQRDGIIVFANSSAARIYGADETEQLVGRESISLVHPQDRHILLNRRDTLKRGETKQVFEVLQRLRLDGSTFYGESIVSLIPWKGAQATMIVVRDNTERQAIEAQLRQAQKMEAVGQLTGGVAHDFNNLLTVVLGNLELLRDDTRENEKLKRFIKSAIRATERGAELTRRLLAFSRKQTLHPKGLDLNELVAGMSDMLQRTLGETIEIEAKAVESLWPVFADPGQVESAVLNLALNARDAMPNGGKLTVEAANIRIDDEYVAAHVDVGLGEYVLLSVSDTGTGMTQEAVRHAFEPFFTTKEVGEGSGLGLSMVYGFAKQSGGHVTIYSEEGHGTTVKLYLPRAKQVDLQGEPDFATGVSGAREETILVVEDDPDVRTLVVALLGDLGYEVLEAGDGASANTAMKSRSRIDLLFTDVILAGGMSGPEISEEAKRLHPAIRILFMSGYPREAMIRRGQLEESADMLNKPFRKADLAQKVQSVLQ